MRYVVYCRGLSFRVVSRFLVRCSGFTVGVERGDFVLERDKVRLFYVIFCFKIISRFLLYGE